MQLTNISKYEGSSNRSCVVRHVGTSWQDVSIPVVDIGGLLSGNREKSTQVAEQIGLAAMDSGFLYIENHGIKEDLIEDVYDCSRQFFSLSEEEKLRYYIGNSPNHRGYVPKTEKGDYSDEPSERAYEAFDLSLDMSPEDCQYAFRNPLMGPNLWPKLAGFSSSVSRYFNAMRTLGNHLCRAFEIVLDLPTGFFKRHMCYPTSQLRLIHYIQQEQFVPNVNMGAHTDYECFTILHSRQRGLQILDKQNRWIEVPVVKGAFAVNIGDLLEAWTNGRFVATAHRVVTDGSERFSLPFFVSTDYQALIEPISKFTTSQQGKVYKPFVAGEHLMGQLLRDFPYLKKRYLNGEISLQAGMPNGNPFEDRIEQASRRNRGLLGAAA